MLEHKGTYFITGTCTSIGKTFVASKLLRAADKKGFSTVGLKPIASGAENGINDDALVLLESSNIPLTLNDINPQCFELPIAPHIAAAQQHLTLDAKQIVESIEPVLTLNADVCLIEGAGGWAVPINDQQTWSDVVRLLDVPVIMVVGMRLGCINHALLTERAILDDGVVCHGWIANRIDKTMLCYEENLATLKQRMSSNFLGEF